MYIAHNTLEYAIYLEHTHSYICIQTQNLQQTEDIRINKT